LNVVSLPLQWLNVPLVRFIPNRKVAVHKEQLRAVTRFKQFSLRTLRGALAMDSPFHPVSGKRHPREVGAPETMTFLSHPACIAGVSH
jgi:hypothetical protein